MSVAIELTNKPLTVAGAVDLACRAPATEWDQRPEPSQISRLQAEVWALREALARAEREVRLKEALLQNAKVRAMTLRAELIQGVC